MAAVGRVEPAAGAIDRPCLICNLTLLHGAAPRTTTKARGRPEAVALLRAHFERTARIIQGDPTLFAARSG